MITGITVIGDMLRPTGTGLPGGADGPIGWLFNAVRRQIGLACGLPVSIVSTRHRPEWHAWLTAERTREDSALFWAARYDSLPERAAFARMILPHLHGRFCAGYELPPYLTAILDHEDIPYVDIRVHPVRFMDDLMFAVRPSDAGTRHELLAAAVPESEVTITAGLREAMCRMISDSTLPNDTLLVLGQRPMDSTQILNGRFFDAADQADRLAVLCARHRAVALKPHPQEPSHSLLSATAGLAPNVIGVVGDNLYRLLATPQIGAVLTVNSSAAYEAPYFSKPVYHLAPLPVHLAWRGDDPADGQHISLNDRVLTVDFWRTVLSPHTAVSRTDGLLLPPKPNRLRIALDSFWNFQEIDTDRIPARRG